MPQQQQKENPNFKVPRPKLDASEDRVAGTPPDLWGAGPATFLG